MQTRTHSSSGHPRRGQIIVFAAALLVMMFAFTAFTIDIGFITSVKGELQNAADAAALGACAELEFGAAAVRTAAKDIALTNRAANQPVTLTDADIELGVFDFASKTFTSNETSPNAVRVTARISNHPLFFGPVIKSRTFNAQAQSLSMLNPRDIVYLVDLSGSMNDDTEPCWATLAINDKFGPLGFPNVATPLMEDVFADFGFGAYPGLLQHIGAPLGVPADDYCYAAMTQDNGPLSSAAIPLAQRIDPADDEDTRKLKAYQWIIANQVAVVMPLANPAPTDPGNFSYWEKYLDYVLTGSWTGDGTPPDWVPPPPPVDPQPPVGWVPPGTPDWLRPQSPAMRVDIAGVGDFAVWEAMLGGALLGPVFPGTPRRGAHHLDWVPYNVDPDQLYQFNNPNPSTFPAMDRWHAWNEGKNKIGYLTYIQFLMDWGRNRSPDVDNATNAQALVGTKTPLSQLSPFMPRHNEATAGGTFSFPPREQPMHAVRRSLIAAIETVRVRNSGIAAGVGDRIAVITFDGLDADHAPQIVRGLTTDWTNAMQGCVDLQAVSDIGATTATEAGLALARQHLKNVADGGAGRPYANKVIILLTDGVPNAWSTSTGTINSYITANPSPEYYAAPYVWCNAALRQADLFRKERGTLFVVGMGLGADYDFLDRMARIAGTDEGGLSVRGSGNPAEYEDRLTEIIEDIVKNPGSRLVK